MKSFARKFNTINNEVTQIRQHSERYDRVAVKYSRKQDALVKSHSKKFDKMQSKVKKQEDINQGTNVVMKEDAEFESMYSKFY